MIFTPLFLTLIVVSTIYLVIVIDNIIYYREMDRKIENLKSEIETLKQQRIVNP